MLATGSAAGARAYPTPDIAAQTDTRPTKPHNQVGIQGKPVKALSPKRPGRVLYRAAADRRNTTRATMRESNRQSHRAGTSSATTAQLRKPDTLAAGNAYPGWRRHWCRPSVQVQSWFCACVWIDVWACAAGVRGAGNSACRPAYLVSPREKRLRGKIGPKRRFPADRREINRKGAVLSTQISQRVLAGTQQFGESKPALQAIDREETNRRDENPFGHILDPSPTQLQPI